MAQVTMYETVVGKPYTTLSQNYTAGVDSQIVVVDATKLPPPPNYLTIATEGDFLVLTLLYTTVSGNTISGLTFVECQPPLAVSETYPVGTAVGRPLTHKDITDIQNNICDLNERMDINGQFTAEDKEKLDGIEESAEVNLIDTVKVDGTPLTPDDNKAVNIDLSGKAPLNHASRHANTGDDPLYLDGSQIAYGTIPIERIPRAALERCIVVSDDTARYALTTNEVDVGDTVKVASTNLMWVVIDTTRLDSDAGYMVYQSVTDWQNIINRPADFPPSAHALQHSEGGSDRITPQSIGAANLNHDHTLEELGAAAVGHTHNAAEVGAAALEHTHRPQDVGASPANHSHTADEVGAAPANHGHNQYANKDHADQHKAGGADPITPGDIGAATAGHEHSEYATNHHGGTHNAGGSDPITPSGIGAAAAVHEHEPEECGAAPIEHSHEGADLAGAVDGTSIILNSEGKLQAPAGPQPTAEGTSYNNENSGLTGQTVQQAIDEIAGASGHQLQADWTQENQASPDFIKNKPTAYPPTTHAFSHMIGGGDELKPEDIGAATAGHGHTGYAPSVHAERHARGGEDEISLEMLGGAPVDHTHTPESLGAADAIHMHEPTDCGAAPVVHEHEGDDIAIDGVTIKVSDDNKLYAAFKQGDWNQTDDTQADFIKNKPSLGTASPLNVPASGDASAEQVVLGSDSRLTDARTPVDHTHEMSEVNGLGTALDAKADDTDIADAVHALVPLQNVTVATSAWATSTDIAEYPYRASISYSGITANHFATVVFNQAEASSGIFANVCVSAANVVYIYASEIPSAAVTIATIIATKGANT